VNLRTSAGTDVENPTGQDIERLLADLPVSTEYEAVIAAGKDAFIQARGEVNEDWANGASDGLILHALDGAGHMFESASRHPPSTVIRVFQLYAQGNPQWKQEIEWKEFRRAGRALLIVGVVIVAALILWWLSR
jgi:hypothetical protein